MYPAREVIFLLINRPTSVLDLCHVNLHGQGNEGLEYMEYRSRSTICDRGGENGSSKPKLVKSMGMDGEGDGMMAGLQMGMGGLDNPSVSELPSTSTCFVGEDVETTILEAQVDLEELESGRGRHVLRNDVDILINNESRAFALLEVNNALKLWRADTVLPGVSFVIDIVSQWGVRSIAKVSRSCILT
ncbi:hypothetical protein R1sor_008197 [Riccia sorocarpa]|uniref:Uncharacterized protein n=1 Tax=Riccia sorocarpa TaxID=122646 RepID=A0ABD3HUC0_9MARC